MSGQMPIGGKYTHNNYFEGNRHTEIIKNDGVYGWLPGGTLNSPSPGKLLGTGRRGFSIWKPDGKSITGFFNSSMGAGSNAGEGFSSTSISKTSDKKVLDTIYKTVVIKSISPYEQNIIIIRENSVNKDTFFFVPSDLMKK